MPNDFADINLKGEHELAAIEVLKFHESYNLPTELKPYSIFNLAFSLLSLLNWDEHKKREQKSYICISCASCCYKGGF